MKVKDVEIDVYFDKQQSLSLVLRAPLNSDTIILISDNELRAPMGPDMPTASLSRRPKAAAQFCHPAHTYIVSVQLRDVSLQVYHLLMVGRQSGT